MARNCSLVQPRPHYYIDQKRSEISDAAGPQRPRPSIVGCSWFHDGGVFVERVLRGQRGCVDAATMRAACRLTRPPGFRGAFTHVDGPDGGRLCGRDD